MITGITIIFNERTKISPTGEKISACGPIISPATAPSISPAIIRTSKLILKYQDNISPP
jgi:hypothetical protein